MSYIVGHPIKHPGDFYGRFEQKQRFFEIISGPQSQSVTILGARRAGKTSFLRHVAHPDVLKQYLSDHEKYIMIYVDVSACKTPSEFYQRTIMKLSPFLPHNGSSDNRANSTTSGSTMFDLESVLCKFPNKRVVLLLDEFDMIRQSAFDQDFLTELRALASVWEYELACVTASYCDLYQLGAAVGLPPTSPFYNIFYPTPIYIGGLDRGSLEQLIVNPATESNVQFERAEIVQMVKWAGTLPFFVQATASAWFNWRRTNRPLDRKRLFYQLAADLSAYFEQWWRQFSPNEQAMLCTMTMGTAVNAANLSEIEQAEAVRWLENLSFIDQHQHPNGLLFHYWLQYLRGKKAAARQPIEPEPSFNDSSGNSVSGNEQAMLLPLYQKMMKHFNMQDMQTVCFELGIDQETLSFQNKQEFVRAMLLAVYRQGCLEQLRAICQLERPQVSWSEGV